MTRPKPLPSFEQLDQLVSYDPDSGELRWKRRRGSNAAAGDLITNRVAKGYIRVRIDKVDFRAQRVIWVLMTREDPGDRMVDHINRVRDDNRWCNLRLTDALGNRHNTPDCLDRDLPRGISARNGSFSARLHGKHGHKWVGTYKTVAEALTAQARAMAA